MSAIVTVYAIFADADEARSGSAAPWSRKRLAACVNILGACHSIYRWQGAIEEADEVAGPVQDHADAADALIARIAELHSYDVPAVVVWPIERAARRPMRDWVERNRAQGIILPVSKRPLLLDFLALRRH